MTSIRRIVVVATLVWMPALSGCVSDQGLQAGDLETVFEIWQMVDEIKEERRESRRERRREEQEAEQEEASSPDDEETTDPWEEERQAAPSAEGDVSTSALLSAHNQVRRRVGVNDLVWSNRLAGYAQQWAIELANGGCDLTHRQEVGRDEWRVGENLFWSSDDSAPVSERQVVNSWASEERDYDPNNNRCAPGAVCGHYTQIVWRDSKQLGCAMAMCGGNGQIWVCNYNPPGNYIGRRPY